MRAKGISILAAMAILATGCFAGSDLTTRHPFLAEKALVFEPALLGAWRLKGSPSDDLTFESAGAGTYKVTVRVFDEQVVMEGRLGRLGKLFFLDLVLVSGTKGPPDESRQAPSLPEHLLLRFSLEKDVLRGALLDPDWLKPAVGRGEVRLGYELVDGDVVLTATTEELQRFLAQYARDKRAFSKEEEFHRQK